MTSLAQDNLVPNGSFEEYSSCPTGNDLNNGQLERAIGWWKPTIGTSDYFNRCHINGVVGVPNNFWGVQEPYHGDAYVGLVPINGVIGSDTEISREYIQTRLTKRLKPCVEYRFSMYLSLAELSKYSIRNIGVCFSQDDNNQTGSILNCNTKLVKQDFTTDSIQWLKFEEEYIADGTEEFLTIGYFEDALGEDTTVINPTATAFPNEYYSYYYIDSVSLVEIGPIQDCEVSFPNVFTPNNDGVNDIYDLSMLTSFENINCFIVNRWGNVVYIFSHENPFWGGSDQNGLDCKEGVYYLVFKGEKYSKTQFIQLVR